MCCVVELLYVQCIVFELNYRSFVVINIAVVRCWKNCNHHWEFWRTIPFVHLVTIELCLVSSQNWQQLVLVQELVSRLLAKEIGTSSHIVLQKLLRTLTFFVFYRIWPQDVAEQPYSWWFLEALKVLEVIDGFEFGGDSSVEGKELVVDEAWDRESVECFHEQVVSFLVVFVETLCSEVEELSHLPALVVSSEHEDCGGVVQFQGVQEHYYFAWERATIYVVPKEKIFSFRRIATYR